MEQMGGDMACQMVEPMQVGMPGVCPEGAGCDGNGSWKPDGLKRPWPRDEYLVDGGDRGLAVEVAPDWTVYGLESEDTVAHFDTLDGQTMVEASNQVCVYAPRFSAVRKVTSLVSEGQVFQAGGVTLPEHLARQGSKQEVWHGEQFVQLGDGYGTQPPVIFDNKQQDEAISTATNLEGASGSVLPYQKLAMIKEGRLEMSESAVLARGVAAAIVWSRFEHVEIVLDGVEAVAFTEADKPFSIYTVDEPPARPKLRLCKIASTAAAKPGEVVEFTLRFDNTGNQPIGNIVLMDNLTARFEYVEGSTDTTLPADFSMELTDTGTTVLRWELKNALNVNQGGVIRFKCRVR
jgi:uncharacterized repeat protein (TIGR01451 family)